MNTTNTNRSNYDKCRLCLADGDENDFIPIFNVNDDPEIPLAVRIMVCLSLPVQAKDSFPRNVCRNCENQLIHFYEFREICYNSYYSLSQDLTQYNAKEKFFTDKPESTKNFSCLRIKAKVDEDAKIYCTSLANAVVQESDVCTEEDISFLRNIHTISNDESTNGETTFDKENMLVENLETDRVANETISNNIAVDAELENLGCTHNEQTEIKRCEDERTAKEMDFSGEAQWIVMYKCSTCERKFADLGSAAIHYEECSVMEQAESVEYLDETYNERTESIEVIEDKSLTSNEKIVNPSDVQDRSIERSKVSDVHSMESSRTRGKVSLTISKRKTQEGSLHHSCSNCESIFTDLSSASEHCAECSVMEQAESAEYLDETYNERTESIEIIEDKSLMSNEKNDHPSNMQDGLIERSKVSDVHSMESSRTRGKLSLAISKRKPQEVTLRHSCSNCKSAFASAALLRRHMVVHTGERPYECAICKKHFSQVGQLNFHKKFHENPRYRCDVCKKPFLRPSDIEKHMRTHTGEKPYACKVCPKSFAQLVALQQHERIHTGDKPYNCEICGKRFSQKANKTKHVKIHKEGAKPHTCEICGRSFSDVEEMNLHRAGHGGGKPRKCNYCEESFRKMSELAQHVRRFHTFERPHKCAFCQKAFYSLYNLKQHVMVHTGQKPYACTRCDLKFTQKGNLTKHFERKHTDKYSTVTEHEDGGKEEIIMSNYDSKEKSNL